MPEGAGSGAPGGPDHAEARRMAAHITGGRPAVAAVFNEIARRTAGGLPDFKIVALGVNDPVEAYARAIQRAAEAQAHRVFLTELAVLGLIDLAAALAAAPAGEPQVGETLWMQDASGLVTIPQGWNADLALLFGPSDLLRAFNHAARRVCLVRAGASQGTGFLIGPQTVLTNWHVVAGLLDPATGAARPGSAASITCTFEALLSPSGQDCHAVEDWLAGFSPLAPGAIHPPDRYPAMTAPQGDTLDFCAIRLAGAPGRERGWYDLADTGRIDNDRDLLWVIQHPKANPQRAGVSTDTSLDPADPAFILHRVWTDEGSSGGLCLDHRLKPVALHHAAVRDAAGAFRHNRAVRLSAINAARPGLGDPDPLHDRISRLADGSRAVIGRHSTQQTLREMMRDPARPILFIRGERRSGKSFTVSLIRDCTAHDRRRMVTLSASEIPTEAHDLARLILTRAGAGAAVLDALPAPTAPNGTDLAWTRSVLMPALRRGLSDVLHTDPARPLVLWLVIDELDLVPIPQTGARDLLDALYADAAAAGDMRVVLIGLDGTLPGIDPQDMRSERLDDPETVPPEALQGCLAALMSERMLAPHPDELRRHADILGGVAGLVGTAMPGATRLERLSDILARVHMRAVQRWT